MKTLITAASLALCTQFALAEDTQTAESPETTAEQSFDLLDIGTPDTVVQLVQDAGFRAQLKTLDDGHKFIESSANGMKFQIHFYGCTAENTGCELLVFTAGFDFAEAQDEEIVSDWNFTRFTKAYLDKEGDPYIQLPVNILYGVTHDNFKDTLVWFTNEMGSFMDHIGWYDEGMPPATPPTEVTPT